MIPFRAINMIFSVIKATQIVLYGVIKPIVSAPVTLRCIILTVGKGGQSISIPQGLSSRA